MVGKRGQRHLQLTQKAVLTTEHVVPTSGTSINPFANTGERAADLDSMVIGNAVIDVTCAGVKIMCGMADTSVNHVMHASSSINTQPESATPQLACMTNELNNNLRAANAKLAPGDVGMLALVGDP